MHRRRRDWLRTDVGLVLGSWALPDAQHLLPDEVLKPKQFRREVFGTLTHTQPRRDPLRRARVRLHRRVHLVIKEAQEILDVERLDAGPNQGIPFRLSCRECWWIRLGG